MVRGEEKVMRRHNLHRLQIDEVFRSWHDWGGWVGKYDNTYLVGTYMECRGGQA